MSLVVLLGGARSGKSRLAVELATASGRSVTFVATGEPGDEEMAARIALHRAERPAAWETIEEPVALEAALGSVDPEDAVVVDCLSLWVSNLLLRGDDPGAIEEAARAAAAQAARRDASVIVVSNEVGLGLVPDTALGRTYRDVLGAVNRLWVAESDRAAFVVAGRALPLQSADWLSGGTE